MEVVGAISGIIAIVTLVEDIVKIAEKIKSSYEKVSENRYQTGILVKRIADSLEQLQEVIQTCSPYHAPTGLRTALITLKSDLLAAHNRCQALTASSANFTFAAWRAGDTTAQELERIEKQVAHCLQMFTTTTCARIERTISHQNLQTRRRLDQVELSLQRLLNEVESNPAKAQNLFAVHAMSRHELEEALHKTYVVLDHGSSPLESQYLRAKVNALTYATRSTSYETTNHPSTHTSRPPTYPNATRVSSRDSPSDFEDSVGEAIRMISSVRNGEVSSPKTDMAGTLDKLSVTLHETGMYENSCDISHWAVQIYQELVQEQSDDFASKLATALDNYSRHLRSRDCQVQNQAVIRTPLHSTNLHNPRTVRSRGDYYSKLALSLSNASDMVSKQGRHEEAFKLDQESVEIYRRLVCDGRVAFQPDLAVGLNNLAVSLSHLRRHDDALQVSEEAVQIYNDLSCKPGNSHQPQLALALHTYSSCLSDSGQHQEALKASLQALQIRRSLSSRDMSTTADSRLLPTLGNAFSMLTYLRRPLKAVEDSVDMYLNKSSACPTVHKCDLASSLLSTSNCFIDLGRHEEGLRAAQEAAELYASLADEQHNSFTAYHATSLDSIYVCLSHLQRYEVSLRVAEQAVQVRRRLSNAQVATSDPVSLARSLTNVFNSLRRLERDKEAVGPIQEAICLYRLARGRSDGVTIESDLASCLHNLSNCLSRLGRVDGALNAAEEAAHSHRRLAQTHPDVFRPRLAGSLVNVSGRSSDMGRHEKALKAAKEAVHIYRQLAKNSSDFAVGLARSLHRTSSCYARLGHAAKATAAREESLRVRISG